MNILVWIIFGLVVGALAKLIKPGADPGGWVASIIIGIVGSILGGFLGNILFSQGVSNEFSFYNIAMSIVGAIIVLFGYHAIKKRS